jgi:hypothetical protein
MGGLGRVLRETPLLTTPKKKAKTPNRPSPKTEPLYHFPLPSLTPSKKLIQYGFNGAQLRWEVLIQDRRLSPHLATYLYSAFHRGDLDAYKDPRMTLEERTFLNCIASLNEVTPSDRRRLHGQEPQVWPLPSSLSPKPLTKLDLRRRCCG